MRRSRHSNPDCKIFIGDLGDKPSKSAIEKACLYYGPIRSIWVARNPPGFAFVEFKDPIDAEDAAKGLHRKRICGRRVRVDLSYGARRRIAHRPFHPDDKCYGCGERGHYARDCPMRRFDKRGMVCELRRSRSRSPLRSRSTSTSSSESRRSSSSSSYSSPSYSSSSDSSSSESSSDSSSSSSSTSGSSSKKKDHQSTIVID